MKTGKIILITVGVLATVGVIYWLYTRSKAVVIEDDNKEDTVLKKSELKSVRTLTKN